MHFLLYVVIAPVAFLPQILEYFKYFTGTQRDYKRQFIKISIAHIFDILKKSPRHKCIFLYFLLILSSFLFLKKELYTILLVWSQQKTILEMSSYKSTQKISDQNFRLKCYEMRTRSLDFTKFIGWCYGIYI